MKIALVSLNDSADVHQWSGLNFFIARSLERAGAEVHRVGPLESRWTPLMKFRQRWHDALGKNYHAVIDPAALDALGESARAAIPGDADVVLSVTSLVAAAVGPLDRPHASWDDATNAAMDEYYPEYREMAGVSRRHSEELGRRAAEAVDLAIYASEWAADSARAAYALAPDRVAVVPFGANLDPLPTDADVDAAINARNGDTCRLLWVGVDWERKGGIDAMHVADRMNALGVKTELTVVGCDPALHDMPRWLQVRGFISKETREGREELARLFARSHFFVMPSRAEAYGLVYAEAAAFGVPSVACRTGGVRTIVVDDLTGLLESANFDAAHATDRMLALVRDRARYMQMARAARRRSVDLLNWEVAGLSVSQRLDRLIRT